jgi:branched-chain amino acid transport system ATP-binding protein
VSDVVLETRKLTRQFGGLTAVNEVDLSVRDGELRALIGPNGAGKTTCINLLSGLFPPSAGRILWQGTDVTAWSAARRARVGIARTMQVTSVFPSLTVYENVWLGAQRAFGRPSAIRSRDALEAVAARANECLELAGIAARAHEPAGSIGHGDQRLLEIAIALALRPKLLLLDEPTAGMSRSEADHAVALIRRVTAGKTLVMVEHDMSVVFDLADVVTVLVYGQVIASGPPAEIRASRAVQDAYLGTPAEIA